jgi:hypothetical protein
MSPPELSADAPVLNVIKPLEPDLLLTLGQDSEFALTDSIGGPLGHAATADVPLGENKGLNDILTLSTDRNSHGVLLLSMDHS